MKKCLLFFLYIGIISCAKKELPIPSPPIVVTPPPKDSLTYLALGDSYTIGQSVDENERFPVQLTQQLRDAGFKIKNPKIIAKTGWRTDNLSFAIDAAKPDSNWNIVTLLIGVNNQYQNVSIQQYPAAFEQLLLRAIAFAKGKKENVFVLSIPDYSYTPFGKNANKQKISQEIDDYNAINKKVAAQYNVTYFDITSISRKGDDEPDLVATDGLHPSGKQYQLWVKEMIETVKKRL